MTFEMIRSTLRANCFASSGQIATALRRSVLVMLMTVFAVLPLCIRYSTIAIGAPMAQPSAPPTSAAIPLIVARADRTAEIIRKMYPKAKVRVDRSSNAIVVVANTDDMTGIKTIISGLDVKSADAQQIEPITIRTNDASKIAKRLGELFKHATFSATTKSLLLVSANAQDLTQIHTIITALTAPANTPPPVLQPTSAFHITMGNARGILRAVSRALPHSNVAQVGNNIVVTGTADDLTAAKTLVDELDKPTPTMPYVAIYKLASANATSVADLLTRSMPSITVVTDKDLNAISVTAIAADQARVQSAVSQLDTQPQGGNGGSFQAAQGDVDVISLRSATPTTAGGGATSATDIASTVTQALAVSAPDIKIVVQPNSTRLVVSGSSRSRDTARRLIEKLDVAEPLVELDTRVLEIDEGSQSQLGLKFPTPVLDTTYSEIQPVNSLGSSPQYLKLQPITRSPLTLAAQLDFLLSTNQAKILEDPRITTFSGRTATLRAGETVNILTTAGGGTGTVATTQIQSFQTGVTLDITPVVNTNDYVTLTLHPAVNSIAGVGSSGVPNIQTRDTTTTVGMRDGQTLIIGGLIEDSDTKSVTKIPLLGDLPIVGRFFQDVGTTHTRNELVVTVTPHILKPGDSGSVSRLSLLPDESARTAGQSNAAEVPSLSTRHLSDVAPQTTVPSATSMIAKSSGADGVFEYGAEPLNTVVALNALPQILFAKAQPTIVTKGTPVLISVVTTSNVTGVTFAGNKSAGLTHLTAVGVGRWEATVDIGESEDAFDAELRAVDSNGASTSLAIPFTVAKTPQ